MGQILRKQAVPIIVGLILLFIGIFVFTFFGLYNVFPHTDKVLHVMSGVIIAWFFSRLWQEKLASFNQFDRILVCIGMAAAVGFFWEILEYSTSLPPLVYHQTLRHYFYVGDLADTLGDLAADIFGGALFGLLFKK